VTSLWVELVSIATSFWEELVSMVISLWAEPITGQIQSVQGWASPGGGYAMVRWLVLSLMSAGGATDVLTGVGGRAQLRPLGLNRSDTKNTIQ